MEKVGSTSSNSSKRYSKVIFFMIDIFNNFYKGKRVLVTGHTGFKGSWLSIWLHELGAEVVVPAAERQVLWLKYYHGYELREIGPMLGLSYDAVTRLHRRAKEQLRELYEKERSR